MKYIFSYRSLFKIIIYSLIILQCNISYSQNLENITNYSNNKFFIENKGQDHPDIKYSLEQGETTLFLRENGYSYSIMDIEKYSNIIKNKHDGIPNNDLSINNHLVHQTFLNTLSPTIYGKEKITTITNYIHGNDPEKWGIGILPSKEVYYDELYKGVDLRYVSLQNEVKYELIVEPHAKTNKISFSYNGQDSIYIDDYGRLVLNTSLGIITEDPPYVYQKINNQIIEIKSSYKLNNGLVNYKIGHYNKDYELIIDPNLIFSTYSGSNSDNWGNTACFDNDGNLYAGSTIFPRQSSFDNRNGTFVFTSGAYQTFFQGGDIDMGIIKFNNSGTNALYATYYGGNGSEVPISMITDKDNNLHILSATSSRDLVSSNSFNGGRQTLDIDGHYSFQGGTDIYLTELNEQGLPINSIYYGGPGNDGIADVGTGLNQNYKNQLRGDIVIDKNGDIIISSYTNSTNLGTENSFDQTLNGQTDGIITKFNSDLSEIKWCNYIGGTSYDALYSLDIDSNNDIFTCGTVSTRSNTDGIVTKISSDGSRRLAQITIGTTSQDEAYFIRTGRDDIVYVTGQTEGSYPVINANFSVNNGGNFIHAISNNLDSTIFSTTFGVPNKQTLVPSALMIDECNKIYFTGWGNAFNQMRTGGISDLVTTPDALKRRSSDGFDFYLMVLEENANSVLYASYLGGNATTEHLDGGMSRFDPSGTVYQSVCTGCELRCENGDCGVSDADNFPLFPNSSNTIFPRQKGLGACNSAAFKFDLSNALAEIDLDGECQNNEVVFQNNSFGATNFTWHFGDGDSVNTINADPVTHRYTKTGEYIITLTAESITQCNQLLTDSIKVFITTNTDTETFRDTLCNPELYQFDFYTDNENLTYTWINASVNEISNNNISNPKIELSKTKNYLIEVSDEFGCSKLDTFAFVRPIIEDNLTIFIEPSCSQDLVGRIRFANETSTSGTNSVPVYEWQIGNINTNVKTPSDIIYTEPDSISIDLNIQLDQCSYDTTFTATFENVVYPNIISPNGDGKNDTYKIIGIEEGQWIVSFTNRWGKEIYKSTDYQNDFGDEKLREGTYYYLITSPDETQCKGWLQVVK